MVTGPPASPSKKLLPNVPLDANATTIPSQTADSPNGVPNPILEEARAGTEAELQQGSYDFGVAWDGDYDRCFFFDEHGAFIEGYYIVGLLAQAILTASPGQTITSMIHG